MCLCCQHAVLSSVHRKARLYTCIHIYIIRIYTYIIYRIYIYNIYRIYIYIYIYICVENVYILIIQILPRLLYGTTWA